MTSLKQQQDNPMKSHKGGYLFKADHDTIKSALDGYAWPGGYPIFLLMTDGGTLCPKCVRKEIRQIVSSTRSGATDGWGAAVADVNWEDEDMICDHCGDKIESAYGDN